MAAMMRRIDVKNPGGPEVMVLEEAPVPEPRDGEVLIRVEAAGVNRPDVLQRKGAYPPPAGASPVLGLEVAGVVVGVGPPGDGTTRHALHEGDRVCALVNGGGYAEYCVAPAGQCLPWPQGYDAVRAACLPETFFTVWANLFDIGRLSADETVLVHGGTSGIGTTAIALAREFGAAVIATAGSDEKCAACEKLGARCINYRTQDFVAEVARLTEGRGVNVVLDMVAGGYVSRNTECLAKDGRLVIVAVQGGVHDPALDFGLVMMKRLTITGSTMRPRTSLEKAAVAERLREKVWPALSAGRCAPLVHATFPLADAAAAHRLMESGAHVGKIALTVP